MTERRKWQGTATELLELLQGKLDPNTKPNMLARRLNASASRLEQDYGVDYRTSRSMDARIICLSELRHDGYDDHDDILAADAAP